MGNLCKWLKYILDYSGPWRKLNVYETLWYSSQSFKMHCTAMMAASGNLANLSTIPSVKKKLFHEIFLILSPWKKTRTWKFSSRWKKNLTVQKSHQESVKKWDYPWKVGKKCAWKRLPYPRKSSKNYQKMAFRGTFDFYGRKNAGEKTTVR